MAKLIEDENKNFIGISGRVGDIVYRYFKETKRTIECKRPRKSSKPPTAKQKKIRRIFRKALLYAREVMRNPVLVSEIERKLKPGQSVHNFAVAEYINAKKHLPEKCTFFQAIGKMFNW